MPVTKITLSTAMRARDVSRPREDHLAEAGAREEAPAGQAPADRKAAGAPVSSGARPAEPAGRPGAAEPPPPRRRRRRRS